jgi:hypothetical protein
MFSWLSRRGCKIDIFRPPDSFRRELEGPRDDKRDWESNRDQHDNQPHDPIWNLQEWENLRGDLNQQPANNRVGDRHFVNIAPLQLGEEIAFAHGSANPTFRIKAAKRGSD